MAVPACKRVSERARWPVFEIRRSRCSFSCGKDSPTWPGSRKAKVSESQELPPSRTSSSSSSRHFSYHGELSCRDSPHHPVVWPSRWHCQAMVGDRRHLDSRHLDRRHLACRVHVRWAWQHMHEFSFCHVSSTLLCCSAALGSSPALRPTTSQQGTEDFSFSAAICPH